MPIALTSSGWIRLHEAGRAVSTMIMKVRISFLLATLFVFLSTVPFASLFAADTQSPKIEKRIDVTIIHVDKYGVYAPNLIFYWDPGMSKQKITSMTGIAEQLRNKDAMITYSTTSDITKDKRPILVDIVPSRHEAMRSGDFPPVKEPPRPTLAETEKSPPIQPREQPKPEKEERVLQKPGKETESYLTKPVHLGSAAITRTEVVNFVRDCIESMQSKNMERALECYGDQVDYFAKGIVNKDFIRRDKGYYNRNWDKISSSIDGDIVLIVIDQPDLKIAKFNSRFYVQNAKNTVSGRAENIWKVQKIGNELKIVDEKQKIIERDSR
jgi:hypothetical protein